MDKISAENNKDYGPLDGLYTYPELADGLFPKKLSQRSYNSSQKRYFNNPNKP